VRAGAVLLASLAVLACDGSIWLSAHQVPHFREVELEEARRIAAQPEARVFQTVSRRGGRAVPGAELVLPDQGWSPEVQSDSPVVILAGNAEDGYRLAARLARSGIQGVAVYAGDIEPWWEPQPGESEEVAATRRKEE
jgi:hypothetical protein